MMANTYKESILIVDFGSQVTQLIARRVREHGVYCEIFPYSQIDIALDKLNPSGIILSGGPASVTTKDAPSIDKKIFNLKIPILGICYGQQIMCSLLGGEVETAKNKAVNIANIFLIFFLKFKFKLDGFLTIL